MKKIILHNVFFALLLVSLVSCTGINYSQKENWAYFGKGENTEADLFFVAPTVDLGKQHNFNMSMKDEDTKSKFVGAINMELGIYQNTCVYAPFYRQITFHTYSNPTDKSEKYLGIAYKDVKKAFDYYLSICDSKRPLILAGFSQGSDMIIRLMKEYFADEKLQSRLVAAYAIGWSLTEDDVKQCPHLVPAKGRNDIGCIIMFNSEAVDVKESSLVPAGYKTYSINPLNWKTDSTPAEAWYNLGCCITDYQGKITKEIPTLTGAYIDETRGTLKCPDVNPDEYKGILFPDGVYHIYDYLFFYRNLQSNVAVRLNAWKALHNSNVLP